MPPITVEALKWHRTRQAMERVAAGKRYQDADLVFAGPTGNALRGDGILEYFWHPALRRLELPQVTLRGGRHTAATLMRQSGMDLKVVQETLGHASMKLTADTYSHVTPAFKRQAVDDFAAYLGVTRTGDGQKDLSDL